VALFGKSEEKAAQQQAAQAEAERLQALSAAEMAEAVMPAFGPDGPRPGHELNILQVLSWLMSAHPGGTKYLTQLRNPTREAIQALENAGLVIQMGPGGPGARLKATSLGETALAEGTVGSRLQGSPGA
jgi:hypothetical protein